jgi:hypothetical protein
MATFSKVKLSGSSNGRAIKIASTTLTAPATTIHATGVSATTIDEVWLYAQNTSASAVQISLGWGATTNPDDLIYVTIPAQSGLTLIVAGLILIGTGAAAVNCTAAAATANVVTLSGYVNRIA